MRRVVAIFTAFLTVAGAKTVHADTWACPPEKDYFSENRLFVAHVTPADKDTKPKLEVFKIEDSQRMPLWNCTLGNEGGPMDVFISDDGKYVATVDECSTRVHGGLGDYVVAFYNKDRLIKNYSLEQILHYPDQIDIREFMKLARRSVSGRSWAYRPIFLDQYNDKLYFCVWLFYGQRWLAWQVSTGEKITINDQMVALWNKKGRLWARSDGIQSKHWRSAAAFLGKVRKNEDRKMIESLLADSHFYTRPVNKWRGEFIRYDASSPKRARAESILAQWDGKPVKEPGRYDQPYYYLGTVEGTVKLPRAPKPGDRYLFIYLIPSTTRKEKWYSKVPVHRITDYFWKYSFHNCEWPGVDIPFRIQGVTPGEYWAKAVWDKATPYSFGDNYIKGPPQPGDYESVESSTITVKAGDTIENVTIDCTHKVTDATR